ncbi:MAG: processing protein [Actinomycetota bacterium]|jgi:DNA processing protein|nr:processing protein [Actinomycetota bacterium]
MKADAASGTGVGELPMEAYAAALAGLPAAGHRRLRRLLERWPAPEAWERVRTGRAGEDPTLSHLWRSAAASTTVARLWADVQDAGVGVAVLGGAGYPSFLADDPEPPAVLFWLGELSSLEHRRVAIVGTRRCSRYGRDMARELGRDLALAGVSVVSGLALGVDGASHAGALGAGSDSGVGPPVAVVGSGLDVVYPRRHADLWAEVGRRGAVLSESPLGTPPEPWRFPVRNRVIAALAEVVVVVESHIRGGSRYTVDAADERGRTVMAVPGSVRSPASAYTNALLADGCPPVRDATDVLVALGLSSATATATATGTPAGGDPRPTPAPDAAAVLDVLGWEPASLEQVVLRSGGSPAEITLALVHLERDGWVESRQGWWERVTASDRAW